MHQVFLQLTRAQEQMQLRARACANSLAGCLPSARPSIYTLGTVNRQRTCCSQIECQQTSAVVTGCLGCKPVMLGYTQACCNIPITRATPARPMHGGCSSSHVLLFDTKMMPTFIQVYPTNEKALQDCALLQRVAGSVADNWPQQQQLAARQTSKKE